MGHKRACVLVLGDLGRSPRMAYHALSLADIGFHVDLIGYEGATPHHAVLNNSRITLRYIRQFPSVPKFLPRLLVYVLKALWLLVCSLLSLPWTYGVSHVLVQNPPSLPTLPVAWLYCRLVGARFLVDWHNYGFSLLAVSLGSGAHPLVRLLRLVEAWTGRRADGHLCVTKAMRSDLEQSWGVQAVVLHDRPAPQFQPITLLEQHDLLTRLGQSHPVFTSHQPGSTVTTHRDDTGEVVLSSQRPAIVISSTSWTEDEDFSILLSALLEYEKCVKEGSRLPKLLCIITGRGPLKEHYIQKVENHQWSNVSVVTPWLQAEDYPKLLACGDLGVSLHTSSSGLDLPMKVVDMFGVCLPVAALNFKCLPELVVNGVNGFVFEDSCSLAQVFIDWFRDFPDNQERNETCKMMKHNIRQFRSVGWNETWKAVAEPLFTSQN